ncbi:MAG: vitamin K epoxide reductase family protein [Bryobacterales bacterium]
MSVKQHALDLDAVSPPFPYNVSAWRQRIPICVLASVGCLTAVYMGLFQWGLINSVWDPVFGQQSEKVLRSETSLAMERWMLVPDAILGAFAYLGDAIYGLSGSTRRWQLRPWMTILFGLDVIPLGVVSAVLVFMQGAVVGYWCFLCIFTAFISLALIYFAYDEVWACVRFLYAIWREGDRKLFWQIFWGFGSGRAAELASETIAQSQLLDTGGEGGAHVAARN